MCGHSGIRPSAPITMMVLSSLSPQLNKALWRISSPAGPLTQPQHRTRKANSLVLNLSNETDKANRRHIGCGEAVGTAGKEWAIFSISETEE